MIYSALLLGLVSSLHCIGMCGPIVMVLPLANDNSFKKYLQLFLYHFGRLTSYGFLGFLFGLLGKGFFIAGSQQTFSIWAGIAMIIVGVVPEKKLAVFNFSKPIYKVLIKIKSILGQQIKKKHLLTFYTIGILNGFLPCGLVYAALFGALAMQQVGSSMLYMILYGLGTIPLMSIMAYISQIFTISFRSSIQKVIPYVVVFVGILFILRGLGLGIPYLSPSIMNLFVQNNPACK